MKWKVRTLMFMGLLVAMSVILTRFSFMPVPTIRIGIRDVPIILSGILFGPLAGAVTGIASDLIGVLTSSQGGFFPGFTLSAALVGLIPGLIFLKQKKESYPFYKIILAVVLVELLVSLPLNTLWLSIMMNKGYWLILPARAITRGIITILEIGIITIIIKALNTTGIVR